MAFEFLSDIRNDSNRLALYVLRVIIGLMWLSEGFIKLVDRYPDPVNDYHFFLQQIQSMADTNPFPFVSSIINNFLVPNYELLAWIVILLEIFLAVSVIAGVFSRIGSFVGVVYTGILFVSALGWGEWIWTYPLIATPMLIIFISSFQTRIGLDQVIYLKYKESKLVKLLI